jgi:asparagine synthase (glutamine-hydrolysing)
MRVDKMTMANSVEARVPFLDQQLVEFAMALPPRMRTRGRSGKVLLKKAVAGLLPAEIVDRPKQGFVAPVAEWFRGDLGLRARRQIRESSLAERGLLDYDAIDRLWHAHRSGRGEWAFQLWSIYNVSAWYDLWVAGRHPAA